MERAVFVVEPDDKIPCLLNPAETVMRRVAGLVPRRSIGGMLTGGGLSDDPFLYTGGGRTELTLNLVFDVLLPGASTRVSDVRELTGPLWRLSENLKREQAYGDRGGYGRPPSVRFFWGKVWNFSCVIAAIAERLEEFDMGGVPRRSWVRMRLLRVADAPPSIDVVAPPGVNANDREIRDAPEDMRVVELNRTSGDGVDDGRSLSADQLYNISYETTGTPLLYKVIAALNGIDDPLRLKEGTIIRVPSNLTGTTSV